MEGCIFCDSGGVCRDAFYGVFANLITYLTGPLHQSTAAVAMNINAFAGSAHMLPLVGAFIGDSFLGRYRTVMYSSFLDVLDLLGLGLLTGSVILAFSRADICGAAESNSACDTSQAQLIFFFTALYLIAIAVSGISRVYRLLGPISSTEEALKRANPRAHSSIGGTVD